MTHPDQVRSFSNNHSDTDQPFKQIARIALGIGLIGLSIFGLFDFPTYRVQISLLLFAYLAVLARYPHSWFILLPALLPALQYAPWSGRVLIDVYDFFIISTLGVLLLRKSAASHGPELSAPLRMLLVLLFCSQMISIGLGLLPLTSSLSLQQYDYYSSLNALRAGKGFLYALVFLFFLPHRQDKIRATRLFAIGCSLGLIVLGMILLWERGVFHAALFGQGYYPAIKALLDFSGEYRVTGLFSDMHTGGAAIDGYLIYCLPFSVFLATGAEKNAYRIPGLVALTLGIYGVLVTFSRSTYVALAILLLVYATVSMVSDKRRLNFQDLIKPTATFVVLFLLAVYVFRRGGVTSMVFVIPGAIAGLISVLLFSKKRYFTAIITTTAGFLISAAGIYWGMDTSKWMTNPQSTSISTGLAVSIASLLSGAMASNITLREKGTGRILYAVIIPILIIVIIVPAVSGYRIKTRVADTATDMSSRIDHWRSVLASMDSSIGTRLLGMGAGTFPAAYLLRHPSAADAGNFSINSEGNNHYLSLGGGYDLKVGQRLAIYSQRDYQLTFRARLKNRPRTDLAIGLCAANILYQSAGNPNCSTHSIRIEGDPGTWQEITTTLHSKHVNVGPWYTSWPTAIRIMNAWKDRTIDIDDISLTSLNRVNLIRNGNFEAGLDNWYFYSEFAHLQWHIKNIFLQVFYEQGLLGISLFLVLVIFAVSRLFQTRFVAEKKIFLALLAGIFTVGLFDSLIDVPRLSFLIYLALFWAASTDAMDSTPSNRDLPDV